MKIDWAAKLTSRKFWIAVCGLVSGLLMAFRADEKTIENITGIIMAGASVLAYCIGEGLADAAGAKTVETYLVDEEAHPPEDPSEDDLK
jgi:hypothetical protein